MLPTHQYSDFILKFSQTVCKKQCLFYCHDNQNNPHNNPKPHIYLEENLIYFSLKSQDLTKLPQSQFHWSQVGVFRSEEWWSIKDQIHQYGAVCVIGVLFVFQKSSWWEFEIFLLDFHKVGTLIKFLCRVSHQQATTLNTYALFRLAIGLKMQAFPICSTEDLVVWTLDPMCQESASSLSAHNFFLFAE